MSDETDQSGGSQQRLDPNNKTTVFISHRLEDAEIAKAVSAALKDLSQDIELYLAGNSKHRNSEFGSTLKDDIASVLDETEVVLILYTHEDEDWSWVMWETGVATDPRNPEKTRIIPISLTGAVPRVFEGKLVVDAQSQESMRTFFKQLCKDPNFFPGLNCALTRREDNWIEEQADKLHKVLAEISPAGIQRFRRCDRFLLRLEVEAVELLQSNTKAMPGAEAMEQILAAAQIITPSPQVSRHFGMAEVAEHTTLAKMRASWELDRAETGIATCETRPWTVIVVEELWRICNNYRPKLTWEPFLGVSDQDWLFPLVIEHAKFPDGAYEFDIAVVSTLKPGDTVPGE
ncbi:MAG: toll/interleukin-1 receptor domain-containing protein [Pseudomonadota bacterium]